MLNCETHNAGLAQLVEHLLAKQKVASSNLVPRSKLRYDWVVLICVFGARLYNFLGAY